MLGAGEEFLFGEEKREETPFIIFYVDDTYILCNTFSMKLF